MMHARSEVRSIMVNKREPRMKTTADVRKIAALLSNAPLLARLRESARNEVARHVVLERRAPDVNQYLFRAGQKVDRMYMIMSGSVAIMSGNKEKESFSQGDTFGAKALASRNQHEEDCKVLEECTFAAIPKTIFTKEMKSEMAAWVKPITTFLKSSAALDGCIHDDFFALTLGMSQKRLSKGELVLSTKNPGPSTLYIVRQGTCSLQRHCKVLLQMQTVELAKLVPGESVLPEMAANSPSDIRIVADSAVVLYCITTKDLQHTRGWGNMKINLANYVKAKRAAWDARTDEIVEVMEQCKVNSRLPPNLAEHTEEQKVSPRSPRASPPLSPGMTGKFNWDPPETKEEPPVMQPVLNQRSHMGEMLLTSLHGAHPEVDTQPERSYSSVGATLANSRAIQRIGFVKQQKDEMLSLPPLTNHSLHTPRNFMSKTRCRRSASVPLTEPIAFETAQYVPPPQARVPRFTLLPSRTGERPKVAVRWRQIDARVDDRIMPRPHGTISALPSDYQENFQVKLTHKLKTHMHARGIPSREAGCHRVQLPNKHRNVQTPEYAGREAARFCAFHGHVLKHVKQKRDRRVHAPLSFMEKRAEGKARPNPMLKTHSRSALDIFSKIGQDVFS